jgi:hypothetical protein
MRLLTEHSEKPGTLYQDEFLLYDGGYAVLNEMNLHESTDSLGNKVVRFKGLLQCAEQVNKNKRMYKFNVLDENVKRIQETIDQGGLIGEMDHPTDSIVHFANASHKITKIWWDEMKLMGEGVILNTPSGKVLRALINDGCRIGMSSRGVGNGKVNEDGILVIGESYKLITFDAVADPSTYHAFQERISDTKKESTQNAMKNEASSIHTVNEKLVLACLSGIIKHKTEELKARL